ncbi:MAG: hypothetical protein Q4C58_07090 [Eubacteriales bacterium]|nr:hypothetical protein [Eubacteriales bacterium]
MSNLVHYLWRNDYASQEEYEKEKERYRQYGFRIVTYQDGEKKNIHEALKKVMQNHLEAD